MTTKLKTPIFRVSYPYVFEPKTEEGKKPEWSCQMIFDPARLSAKPAQSALLKGLRKAVEECAKERFGQNILKDRKFKSPFKDGNDKDDDNVYPEDSVFIETKTKLRAPTILDQNKGQILDAEEFYAGCFAHATVSVYAWEYQGKKGVSFGLFDIQKVRDGERIGSFSTADDDFGADVDENIGENFDEMFGDMVPDSDMQDLM